MAPIFLSSLPLTNALMASSPSTAPPFPFPLPLPPFLLLFLLCLLSTFPLPLISAQAVPALVFLDPPSSPRRFLLPSTFSPPFSTSPTRYTLASAPSSDPYACGDLLSALPSSYPPSTLLLVRRGPPSAPCPFTDKARNAQHAGAAVVIVTDYPDTEMGGMGGMGGVASPDLTILSAFASYEDGVALQGMGAQEVEVEVRRYVRPVWDVSFALMFVLAWTTLIGSAWLSAAKERRVGSGGGGGGYGVEDGEGEVAAYLDVRMAACFIVAASAALLTLFFLIQYLIYALLAVFALSGGGSLVALLSLALSHFLPSHNRTIYRSALGAVRLYTVVAFIPALIIAVTWLVYRNASWAWVLQDVLGVSLLLQFQRVTRLGSIKVASILLTLAFLYDIFWVFLSPLLFSSSVMTTVATGGSSGEVVPMLLRLPRFNDELHGVTMLGLGDVALPGLLVSLLLRFDYHRGLGWKKGYFVPVVVGYAVGVWLTYAALVWMEKGQPALLYIVPCTLFVILGMAWWRGDLKALWEGSDEERKEERMANARLNGARVGGPGAVGPTQNGRGHSTADASSQGMTAALLRTDSSDSDVV